MTTFSARHGRNKLPLYLAISCLFGRLVSFFFALELLLSDK